MALILLLLFKTLFTITRKIMIRIITSFLLAIILFTGCSPKYYTPNTQNVPLISQKGETNLTVSGNGNQVEFQGAYGVTNGFAIKANGGLFIPKDLDNGNGGSGSFAEVGGGYFKPIGDNWVFESYGIFGLGYMENHLPSTTADYPQTEGDISANILRFGVQPNFGYKSKYFCAAVSSRIVSLNYNNVRGDLIFENEDQVAYLRNNRSTILLEPALTLRGGFEKIKLQMQIGYSLNATNTSFRQDNTYMTLGLNFNFK
jgi:hypothetical protein